MLILYMQIFEGGAERSPTAARSPLKNALRSLKRSLGFFGCNQGGLAGGGISGGAELRNGRGAVVLRESAAIAGAVANFFVGAVSDRPFARFVAGTLVGETPHPSRIRVPPATTAKQCVDALA